GRGQESSVTRTPGGRASTLKLIGEWVNEDPSLRQLRPENLKAHPLCNESHRPARAVFKTPSGSPGSKGAQVHSFARVKINTGSQLPADCLGDLLSPVVPPAAGEILSNLVPYVDLKILPGWSVIHSGDRAPLIGLQ